MVVVASGSVVSPVGSVPSVELEKAVVVVEESCVLGPVMEDDCVLEELIVDDDCAAEELIVDDDCAEEELIVEVDCATVVVEDGPVLEELLAGEENVEIELGDSVVEEPGRLVTPVEP